MRWLPLIERWHPEFPELDPAWLLGMIAQESQGDANAIADDTWGSTGLMQVGPRSWTGTRSRLLNPAYNIFVGMRMLSAIMDQTDGDIRRAMAAYNCGFKSLDAGKCHSYGGYAYSDKILDLYVPIFRTELFVLASDNDWLTELGYDNGLGRWQREESTIERLLGKLLAHFGVRIE